MGGVYQSMDCLLNQFEIFVFATVPNTFGFNIAEMYHNYISNITFIVIGGNMHFLDFVKRHCALSYWLTWAYIFLTALAVEVVPYAWANIILGLLILPANIVSWTISIEVLGEGKWKSTYPRVLSAFTLQPMFTAFIPIYLLFFY